MSGLTAEATVGVLEVNWSTTVGDYAIAGGWSSDGERLIVADTAGGIYAFGRSGETMWERNNTHEDALLAMALHPNGEIFATSGQDGYVLLWDVLEGQVSQQIHFGGWVEHLAWSRDGQWLAASSSRQVRTFDVDGAEVWRSDEHTSTVSALAWSDTELGTASYSRVQFFDASTGAVNQTLEWKGSLLSIVLSPDGDVVACGSQDKTVHFWRRSTESESMMSGYHSKPSSLVFDDTGTLLATGGGDAVTVWSFQGTGPEGSEPGVLSVHSLPVSALSFAPGKKVLASGARDGSVVVWSLQDDGQGGPVGASLVSARVAELCWSPDGRSLVALDAHGGVTVWSVS